VFGTPSSGLWIGGTTITKVGFTSVTGVGFYRRAVGASNFVSIALPPAPSGAAFANPFRFDGADATSDTTVLVLGAARTGGPRPVITPAVWRGTSADNGVTFSWSIDPRLLPDPLPVPDYALTAIWGTGPNDTWAAGAYGRLRHWDGNTWSQAALSLTLLPEVTPLYGLWGKDSTDFWVVGDNLAIHKLPAISP
jgi:hypothetical protein